MTDYLLQSFWTPETAGESGSYRLVLTNLGTQVLRDFRLAFSGPARLGAQPAISGGRLVEHLSNHCEVAPDGGLELAPGERWSVEITGLSWPLRHWTDGALGGYVIHADGTTTAVRTEPTRLAGGGEPRRRGTMRIAAATEPGPAVSVVPWPRAVDVSGRRSPPTGLALRPEDAAAAVTADSFRELTRLLFPGEGLVREAGEGGLPVACRIESGRPGEAYRIDFAAEGVAVTGGAGRGLLYGLVTLGQVLRGARLQPERFVVPAAGHIEDVPQHGWRGCHLDVARRFYGSDEIRRFLAILAWNKLNVFHWHLCDDEAWRVEIEAFPELVTVGGWRGHGLPVPPLLGGGPEPSGGFYSKGAVRSMVAWGAELGIDVVPEIDVPGHCYALLQALPQLRDPGETGTYHSIQGFPNNCLNPAVEAVYPALETILSELCELFPAPWFHLGADEVPEEAWSGSPLARELLAQIGGGGAAELQAHFLSRMHGFLAANGKIAGAWEEAAAGGGIGREGSYLVGWRTAEAARELAAAGYKVVVAPGQAYYLDMANSADWQECGASWAGASSPEATYGFDPAAGWSADERANLLGVQGCIWSEPMADPAVFDRLVFPRLSAIAETGWTVPAARNYDRFATLAGLMPNLYGHAEEGLP